MKKKTKRQLDAEIAAMLARPVLSPGDEAFAIVTRPVGKNAKGDNRRAIVGPARVQIVASEGDTVVATVLAGSGAIVPGHRLSLPRDDVYASKDRGERKAFAVQVDRFWGPEAYRK
jgi:hypothetical protein